MQCPMVGIGIPLVYLSVYILIDKCYEDENIRWMSCKMKRKNTIRQENKYIKDN